jgi:hypothetical protein
MAFPTARSVCFSAETVNTTSWDVYYPGASAPNASILDGGSTWMAAGDLLLLTIGCDGSTRSFSNLSTGWTNLKSALTDTTCSLNIWYKEVLGTETESGLIGTGATNITCSGSEQGPWRMTCFKNYFGSSSIAVSTGATGSGTAPNPDQVSWGWTADTLVRAVSANDGSVTYSAFPANYDINQFQDSSGGGNGAGLASAGRQVTTSPEDPGAFTMGSDGWASAAVAIRGIADVYQPRHGFVNHQNPGVL